VEARAISLGFAPALPARIDFSSQLMAEFRESVQKSVCALLPGASFIREREEVLTRIQNALASSGRVPPDTTLNIFGSSQNNFGSEGK